MGWRPDPGDYDRHGEGDLLQEALHKIKATGVRPISDSGGVCAYQTKHTIIVAKKALYGNIVSVASHLIRRAKDQGLWIIMYVAAAKSFYQFDPEDIEDCTQFRNHYGLEEMHNFSIKLGRRIS